VLGQIRPVTVPLGVLPYWMMRRAEETPATVRKTVQDRPIRALEDPKDGGQDRPHDGLDRLTVAEAAERLGITQDAVRKRIARGSIAHERDPEGRIFVYLDTFERSSKTVQDSGQDASYQDGDQTSKTVQDAGQDKYTESLEDQIQFLRRELERKDAIILSLTQRIPELEAPSSCESPETRDAPETATEGTDKGRRTPRTTGARTAPLVAVQVLLRAVGEYGYAAFGRRFLCAYWNHPDG